MVFLRRRHRAVLTDSPNPRNYWKVLKNRLKKEGSELVTNCNQLKLQSSDGKYYMQDVLDTKGVLRLVQSIPSPKAEPFNWFSICSPRSPRQRYPDKSVLRLLKRVKTLPNAAEKLLIRQKKNMSVRRA